MTDCGYEEGSNLGSNQELNLDDNGVMRDKSDLVMDDDGIIRGEDEDQLNQFVDKRTDSGLGIDRKSETSSTRTGKLHTKHTGTNRPVLLPPDHVDLDDSHPFEDKSLNISDFECTETNITNGNASNGNVSDPASLVSREESELHFDESSDIPQNHHDNSSDNDQHINSDQSSSQDVGQNTKHDTHKLSHQSPDNINNAINSSFFLTEPATDLLQNENEIQQHKHDSPSNPRRSLLEFENLESHFHDSDPLAEFLKSTKDTSDLQKTQEVENWLHSHDDSLLESDGPLTTDNQGSYSDNVLYSSSKHEFSDNDHSIMSNNKEIAGLQKADKLNMTTSSVSDLNTVRRAYSAQRYTPSSNHSNRSTPNDQRTTSRVSTSPKSLPHSKAASPNISSRANSPYGTKLQDRTTSPSRGSSPSRIPVYSRSPSQSPTLTRSRSPLGSRSYGSGSRTPMQLQSRTESPLYESNIPTPTKEFSGYSSRARSPQSRPRTPTSIRKSTSSPYFTTTRPQSSKAIQDTQNTRTQTPTIVPKLKLHSRPSSTESHLSEKNIIQQPNLHNNSKNTIQPSPPKSGKPMPKVLPNRPLSGQMKVPSQKTKEISTRSPVKASQQVQIKGSKPQVRSHMKSHRSDTEDETNTISSDASRGRLTTRLKKELVRSKESDELVSQLQEDYDNLLSKYALAEVTIDQLRLGAKISLHADPPTPGQAYHGVLSAAQKPSVVQIPRASQGQLGSVTPQHALLGNISQDSSSEYSLESPPRLTATAAGESLQMALMFQCKGLEEQLNSFETLLNERQLNEEEQQKVHEHLKEQYNNLQREYNKAKEEHEVMRRQKSLVSGGTQAYFDDDQAVEGELFKLGCKVEQNTEAVQTNLNNVGNQSRVPFHNQRRVPFQGQATFDALPDRFSPSLSSTMRSDVDTDQPDGLTQQMDQLENEYKELLKQYDNQRRLPRSTERDQNINALLKRLQELKDESPGLTLSNQSGRYNPNQSHLSNQSEEYNPKQSPYPVSHASSLSGSSRTPTTQYSHKGSGDHLHNDVPRGNSSHRKHRQPGSTHSSVDTMNTDSILQHNANLVTDSGVSTPSHQSSKSFPKDNTQVKKQRKTGSEKDSLQGHRGHGSHDSGFQGSELSNKQSGDKYRLKSKFHNTSTQHLSTLESESGLPEYLTSATRRSKSTSEHSTFTHSTQSSGSYSAQDTDVSSIVHRRSKKKTPEKYEVNNSLNDSHATDLSRTLHDKSRHSYDDSQQTDSDVYASTSASHSTRKSKLKTLQDEILNLKKDILTRKHEPQTASVRHNTQSETPLSRGGTTNTSHQPDTKQSQLTLDNTLHRHDLDKRNQNNQVPVHISPDTIDGNQERYTGVSNIGTPRYQYQVPNFTEPESHPNVRHSSEHTGRRPFDSQNRTREFHRPHTDFTATNSQPTDRANRNHREADARFSTQNNVPHKNMEYDPRSHRSIEPSSHTPHRHTEFGSRNPNMYHDEHLSQTHYTDQSSQTPYGHNEQSPYRPSYRVSTSVCPLCSGTGHHTHVDCQHNGVPLNGTTDGGLLDGTTNGVPYDGPNGVMTSTPSHPRISHTFNPRVEQTFNQPMPASPFSSKVRYYIREYKYDDREQRHTPRSQHKSRSRRKISEDSDNYSSSESEDLSYSLESALKTAKHLKKLTNKMRTSVHEDLSRSYRDSFNID